MSGYSSAMDRDQELVRSIWPEWQLMEALGTGQFGMVYKARKRGFAGDSFAAVKIVTIENTSRETGLDIEQTDSYLASVAHNYAREIKMQLNKYVDLELIGPKEDLRAYLDPKLLRLVTMHLLTNASQHTYQGKVTWEYAVRDNGLYVSVTDTGEGLPDGLRENIFALLSDAKAAIEEDAEAAANVTVSLM